MKPCQNCATGQISLQQFAGHLFVKCQCGISGDLSDNKITAITLWDELQEKLSAITAAIAMLSDKELAMLHKLAHNEFNDDIDWQTKPFTGINVWSNCIIESRSDGGVFTSLQKKGIVVYWGYGIKSEDTVGFTQFGYAVCHRVGV